MKNFFKTELVRYMIVGASATLVDTAIFFGLTTFYGISRYPAFIISFPFGVLVNFILCDTYVFQERTLSLCRSIIRHYSASIGGFVMQFLLFFCFMSLIEFPYPVIARIIVAACTFLLNFLIIKRFVFGHK